MARILDKQLRPLAKYASWMLLARVVMVATAFVQMALVKNALGIAALGMFAIIRTYVGFVQTVLNVRVWEVTTKYLAEALVKKEPTRFAGMLKLSYIVAVSVAVVGTAVALLLGPWACLHVLKKEIEISLVAVFAIGAMFVTINDCGQAVLRVLDHYKLLAAWLTATAVVRVSLVAAALSWHGTLMAVLIALLVTALVGGTSMALLAVGATRKRIGSLGGSPREYRGQYREIAVFLAHLNMGNMWGAVVRHLDVLILTRYWGEVEVGYFWIAKRFVRLFGMITDPIYQTLFPELTKLWAKGNVESYMRLVRKLTILLGAGALVAGAVFFAVAPLVVELVFGADALPAAGAIRIMVWGAVIAIAFIWARPSVIAVGKPSITNIAGFIAAAIFVAVTFLTVPAYGLLASATASLIPYVVGHVIVLGGLALHLRQHPRERESLP